jgi:hypothetical protein
MGLIDNYGIKGWVYVLQLFVSVPRRVPHAFENRLCMVCRGVYGCMGVWVYGCGVRDWVC